MDVAAYTIGCAVLSRDILIDQRSYDFPDEKHISKTNLDEAKYWLQKVVRGECDHKIMGKADMIDAQEVLQQIEDEEHEKKSNEVEAE